jgi:hypothetical protein
MEEDLIEKMFELAGNSDFGLIPGLLLQQEIHFREKFPIDRTRSLYRLCVDLALHYYDKPYGITSQVHFDYLQKKVSENLRYAEQYGGFETTEFHEVAKFEPVIISEKDLLLEIEEHFKKGNRNKKKRKLNGKFNPKNVSLDYEPPLNEEEKKSVIERAKKVFEEADSLSNADLGMYDVYYGYSNIELKTKDDYNFLRDGSEFDEFKLCFAFRLRQSEKDNIRPFFKYQLRVNFKSDKEEFKDFVKDIIDGFNEPEFFPEYLIKPVNNFLGEDYMRAVEKIVETDEEVTINTEIRVKAMKYLLHVLKVNTSNQNQVEFIRFIFGKDISKTQGSREQKFFSGTFKSSREKEIQDLKKIVALFESLKLTEALELAKTDLTNLSKLKN